MKVQEQLVHMRPLGADVLTISFDNAERAALFASDLKLEFPLASDPDRSAYDAYGLNRAGLARLLHPKVIAAYTRLIRQGQRPSRRRLVDDLFQLGGDFIIDSNQMLAYAYRSEGPEDRPPVDTLFAELQKTIH